MTCRMLKVTSKTATFASTSATSEKNITEVIGKVYIEINELSYTENCKDILTNLPYI